MLTPPDETALKTELIAVRDEGLPRLRNLALPELTRAARVVCRDDASAMHVVVEALLRRAVSRLGGGKLGDAAVALFGLAEIRVENSKVRRESAAAALERKFETFRKNYEIPLLDDTVTQIAVLVSEQHTRDARNNAGSADDPLKSAMPLLWHDRFAAYYRIWTPVHGLAADLTAYRATLLETDKPWDRLIGTYGDADPGYSQDEQAEGYALFALYHYARYSWELKQFMVSYGGQWLLSALDAEQAVADAIQQIDRASPWNERDDSYLRTLLNNTPGQEMHGFIRHLRSEEIGRVTEQEWYDWCATCHCRWTTQPEPTERFPTTRDHGEISGDCRLHHVVEACGVYLRLIDADWETLADWYRRGGS